MLALRRKAKGGWIQGLRRRDAITVTKSSGIVVVANSRFDGLRDPARLSKLVGVRFRKILFLIFVTSAIAGEGQNFTNLDFESADLNEYSTNPSWNVAAPGWSHSDGDDTLGVYLDSGHVGISQVFSLVTRYPFSGQISFRFSSGWFDNQSYDSPFVQAFISQTGLIPSDSETIRLLATGPFKVYVANVEIPMRLLGNTQWVGNVGAFAGQVAELKIVNTTNMPHRGVTVDNIGFGPSILCDNSIIYKQNLIRTRRGAGSVTRTRFIGWIIFNPTNIALIGADVLGRRFKIEQVGSQIDVIAGRAAKSYTILRITSGELTGLIAKGIGRQIDILENDKFPNTFRVSGSNVYPLNGSSHVDEYNGVFIFDKNNTRLVNSEKLDFDQTLQRLREMLMSKGYIEE